MDLPTMAVDQSLHGVAEIAEKVPAVGDLDGGRRPVSSSFRIGSGSVANDDLDPGMLLEPLGDCFRRPIRKEIDDAPAFEIADDGAVALTAAERPVVDADDAGRWMAGGLSRPDEAQQGVTAHRHGKPHRQARSGLTAEREPEMALNIAKPYRAPRLDARDGGQPLGEDPAGAVRRRATKTSRSDLDHDGTTLPGKVCQPAPVARMQARRWLAA